MGLVKFVSGNFSFSLLLTGFGLGKEIFRNGDLTYVRFQMLRIPAKVATVEAVDGGVVNYTVRAVHTGCLSSQAFSHIVKTSDKGSVFAPSVFFHPNVNVDGWMDLRAHYSQLAIDDEPLPSFPSTPKFWELAETGSTVRRWPPRVAFFSDWTRMVLNGGDFSLDPSPRSIAGPSTRRPGIAMEDFTTAQRSPGPDLHHDSPSGDGVQAPASATDDGVKRSPSAAGSSQYDDEGFNNIIAQLELE